MRNNVVLDPSTLRVGRRCRINAAPAGTPAALPTGMTIQQPPNDEIPTTPPEDDRDDATAEPEQRAPGPDQMPVGAPRDEPDSDG